MIAERLARTSPGRVFIRRLFARRSDEIVERIEPHLPSQGRVIDIGAGPCQIAARLMARGLDVTPVDVRNMSCEPGVVPLLVDGVSLPFADGTFSVALLVTVLHHTADPERVLAEAARVARRVIVLEDIYDGEVQRIATMAMDSIVNLEFLGHPHSNRSDAAWRATFDRLGLRLIASSQKPFWRWFRMGMYVVEPMEERRPAVSA